MRCRGRVQPGGEGAIVADHAAVAVGPGVLQREPHLQGAEAARVLRPEVHVVDPVAVGEVVVHRVIRERGAEHVGIAGEQAAGLERRVQPLVRIDGDRVGQVERPQVARRVRQRRRECAVGAVDVEPRAHLAADVRDGEQRIDRARAHRPGRANHDHRDIAGGDVSGHRLAQQRRVESKRASVAIQRMASVPRPDRSAAFWTHVCVSAEAYTRSRRCVRRRRRRRCGCATPRPPPRVPRRTRRCWPCCRRSRTGHRSPGGSRAARRSSAPPGPRSHWPSAPGAMRRRWR